MKQKGDIPLTHLWIYSKLKERYGCREVKLTVVMETIRRVIYQIPKKFDYEILEELEFYGLIRKIDRVKCCINIIRCAKLKKIEEYFVI